MDRIKFINVTKISASAFDSVSTNLTTQQTALNISFDGQLPQLPSPDTLCDSGSEIFVDRSNDPIMYFLTFCLLALVFGGLFGFYLIVKFVQVMVLVFRRRRLEMKLKKMVKRVDKLGLEIQMKDMEIKMSGMEMKVDDFEGKADEKLTQERLDHQAEMLDWKAEVQKEKDDLKLEIPKGQNKIYRIQRSLTQNFLYI
ncbi:uncharacterized protein Bfra_000131 [Botrytis fragariae]|uniref:Uncharacterized protein n=1 Tax=Botrytis fragariae TaxID=1964551 RepID=A0A8H6EMN6_9HELO|nr:uncharacterized protein Bfra_000131 [Botrytis fragariae]KAF5877966.1 hypothetical protein Bfra_000131 [Botrytis fragariae]